ncbi:MAG: type II secretion system F family protein [Armatimonadetes bacterium]|nr:type II secretion system F family protein [Armatimonadota bacterium]
MASKKVQFLYEGVDPNGNRIKGVIESPTVQDAVQKLHQEAHLFIVRIDEKRRDTPKEFLFKLIPFNRKELCYFFRQLSVIVNSGIPLLRGIRILHDQNQDIHFKKVLFGLYRDLSRGTTFSAAMAHHRKYFSNTHIGMILVAEKSGGLPEALDLLAEYEERETALRAKAKAATTYPLVLLIVSLAVLIYLTQTVLPLFQELFLQSDVKVPLLTGLLLNASMAIRAYWPFWIVVLPVLSFFLAKFLKRWLQEPEHRKKLDYLFLRIPKIGAFLLKYHLARLALTLSALVRTGIPLVGCMNIFASVAGTWVLVDAIRDGIQSLHDGGYISDGFRGKKGFPPLFVQMLSLGEESGTMPVSLAKLASYFEEEVEHGMTQLLTLLEPLLLLFMGAVVVLVLLSVMIPMGNFISKMQ